MWWGTKYFIDVIGSSNIYFPLSITQSVFLPPTVAQTFETRDIRLKITQFGSVSHPFTNTVVSMFWCFDFQCFAGFSVLLFQFTITGFSVLLFQFTITGFCVLLFQFTITGFSVLLFQFTITGFCVLLFQFTITGFCVLLFQFTITGFSVLMFRFTTTGFSVLLFHYYWFQCFTVSIYYY